MVSCERLENPVSESIAATVPGMGYGEFGGGEHPGDDRGSHGVLYAALLVDTENPLVRLGYGGG